MIWLGSTPWHNALEQLSGSTALGPRGQSRERGAGRVRPARRGRWRGEACEVRARSNSNPSAHVCTSRQHRHPQLESETDFTITGTCSDATLTDTYEVVFLGYAER
jgi:hypothetical protein